TNLFDEKFTPEEAPLIDRVFPQVRLSKFSNSVIRDSRDDLLDPSRGRLLALNSDIAARAIGSEVGFIKTFAQAFEYYRLPVRRPAAGFGVHYRSPVGPIRVELGFNLARRELVPGVLERRTVLHISLGQAF